MLSKLVDLGIADWHPCGHRLVRRKRGRLADSRWEAGVADVFGPIHVCHSLVSRGFVVLQKYSIPETKVFSMERRSLSRYFIFHRGQLGKGWLERTGGLGKNRYNYYRNCRERNRGGWGSSIL